MNASDDSFSTFNPDDKTILRPSPGGRKRRAPTMAPSSGRFSDRRIIDTHADFHIGDNPFVNNAFSLLSIVPKLRMLPYHHGIDELQEQLGTEIRKFENDTLNQGATQEQVKIASYFLCSLIDETVLTTPWGNQSSWGQQSLLIQFHREARGGERFFQILEQLEQNPTQNLKLLELAYLSLSMGFEGKFRHVNSGLRELDQLHQELYLLIQKTKDTSEQALSAHWQGLREKRIPVSDHVPAWVAMVAAGALLLMIYLGFAYTINKSSNMTYNNLAKVSAKTIKIPPAAAKRKVTAVPVGRPGLSNRFERLLEAEIAHGMVQVLKGNTLRLTNAFPSGSDRVKKAYKPMLVKIAHELQRDNSMITVIGHTDNQPIFSARFPSNWHLSEARAKNVAGLMAAAATLQGRIRYEGHADNEPVAPNDTAANRARNRRIDIQIR
jgi:type VI secretion system protein ImpK